MRTLVGVSILVAFIAGCGSADEVAETIVDSVAEAETAETTVVEESPSEVEGAIEPGDSVDTEYEPPSEEELSSDGESDSTQTATENHANHYLEDHD